MTLPNQIATTDRVTLYRQSINGLAAYVPPVLQTMNMAPLVPYPGFRKDATTWFSFATFLGVGASVALCYLPHRVELAGGIRWSYTQHTTAAAGGYVLAIYNALGSKLSDTGTVALTGAANATVARADGIAKHTFEAGAYYVLAAFDITNGGDFRFANVDTAYSPVANVGMRQTLTGFTPPNTLSGMTDQVTATSTGAVVPIVALTTAVHG